MLFETLVDDIKNSYYKVRQAMTNCDRGLLQSASDITRCDRLLLQSVSGITKCDRLLLQSASRITKCDSYYKVRCNTVQSPKSGISLICYFINVSCILSVN